jgi:cytochrome oxidase Cu insertion factor (SCO1/SenC/PrrC family)
MNNQSSKSASTQPAAGGSPPAPGTAVPYFLALAVFVAMLYGGWKWWQVRHFELQRGQAIPAAMVGPPIKEFTFTERSGQPLHSADLKGKVWVASYFFTTCPGSCLTVNRNIQRLHKLPELQDVTWVSITCDPDTDTLEALRKYADGWQADPERWLFARAELPYTQQVAKGMDLTLFRKGHQDRVVVFDKNGHARGYFDAMSNAECGRLRDLLVRLLAEEPQQDLATAAEPGKKSS